MPEELALAEHVENLTVVDQLDRPAPHDPQMLERLLALAEDRRAPGEELHLDRPRDLLQLLLSEIVERSVATQELDYVVHDRSEPNGLRSTDSLAASLLARSAASPGRDRCHIRLVTVDTHSPSPGAYG